MAQTVKRIFFDSDRLLNLLNIIPQRLEEEGLRQQDKNELSTLLKLLQHHQPNITQYKENLSDRRYPLPVLESQKRLIGTLS
ncbi:MAG: hypothetical protein RLZZ223_311 [Candidatus Parcubacteria bacterium]|jgi:hypothetical protein